MKITLPIDKAASLIAGIEATANELTLDIPAASIPADIRPKIIERLDLETGTVNVQPADYGKAHLYGYNTKLPDTTPVAVLANHGATEFIAVLTAHIASQEARAAAFEEACKVHAENTAAKAKADAAKAAADTAETIEKIKSGEAKITGVSSDRVYTSINFALSTSHQELAPFIAAYQAEQEAAAAERKRREDAEKADREAKQIKGNDTYIWPLDQETIDQSTAADIPYDSGRHSKNWIATVRHQATAPGKLDRDFWSGGDKARVMPAGLQVGDYLEGAEKDKKGRKTARYYRVLRITEKEMIVRASKQPGATPPSVAAEVERLNEIYPTAEKALESLAALATSDATAPEPEAPAPAPAKALADYTDDELEAEMKRRKATKRNNAASSAAVAILAACQLYFVF
jgi:hypothetical protein